MTDLASDSEEFWERRHDLPVTTTTDDDVAGLVEALEHDRALAVGPVTVDALDLVRVDLRDRFPQFERVERYPLA